MDRMISTIVGCMDLTSLQGDETLADIERLCRDAREPLPGQGLHVAAVCVYQQWVPLSKELLQGSGVRVATVAGFPGGDNSVEDRCCSIAEQVDLGADEVDVVISWRKANAGLWSEIADEIAAFRRAAGDACLKTILSTGLLDSANTIRMASRIALDNGADFIKTSTGKDVINATLEAGEIMCEELHEHHARTGQKAGIKPAGGIRDVATARKWLDLVREKLGEEWLMPDHFRIGASTLLQNVRQLTDR